MTEKPTSDDFYDAPPLQVAAQYLRWQADRDYWGHNEPMELRMLADRLEAEFAAERSLLDEALRLLSIARCPDEDCEKGRKRDAFGNPVQCQFCAEHDTLRAEADRREGK